VSTKSVVAVRMNDALAAEIRRRAELAGVEQSLMVRVMLRDRLGLAEDADASILRRAGLSREA
jgi:hypothetical protein